MNLYERDNKYILCEKCVNVTGFHFNKCHICNNPIKIHKLSSIHDIDLYSTFMKVLTDLQNIPDQPVNMISISIKGDTSESPELWQIQRFEKEFVYNHYVPTKNNHEIKETFVINSKFFAPILPSKNEYELELLYGENFVYY